ncbi:hypothetical protein SKAU_G00284640 [Synaphobranchus kaupii]|uniref:PiggyBac transposable element-derived protein domain-containing protein n=1 Tax=Synaphobranchus kaupii TaxID=118154 RepID=A0A9Q1IPC3_SYNKA|nr:hypothetical protein SKAU_G00284640 [Synaphobranchus kaupii]
MPLSDVAEEIFRSESEGGVKVALTLKAKTVVEDAFAQGEDVAVDIRCFCSGQSWTLCSCSCTCSSPPHDSRQGGPALIHREELKQDQASQSPSLRTDGTTWRMRMKSLISSPFCPRRTPEVQLDLQQDYSPLDLFRLFFSTDVLKLLCDYTNGNTARKHAQGLHTPWSDVDAEDMLKYLYIVLYLGLAPRPRHRRW